MANAPVKRPRPGGQEFWWPDTGIAIRLERIREHTRALTAELWVTHTNGAGKETTLEGALDLTLKGPTSRESLAKKLAARTLGIQALHLGEWRDMVSQACILAVQEFRKGEEFLDMAEQTVPQEIKWRLYPLLPDGVTTLLYGSGGIGKTTLATACAMCVQTGLPLVPSLSPVKGHGLILDWETNADIAVRTVQMLTEGCGQKAVPKVLYRRCHGPLIEQVEDIQAQCTKSDIQFVIVDSAVAASGGEEQAIKNALPVMDALRSLKDASGKPTSNLIISHPTKDPLNPIKTSYGSGFWHYNCRHVWEAKGHADYDAGTTDIALFLRKTNVSRMLRPLGWRFTWTDTSIAIIQQDPGKVPELRTGMSWRLQIEAILKEHQPLTIKEIAEALECPDKTDTLRAVLNRYKSAFIVVPSTRPDQVWRLARQETL